MINWKNLLAIITITFLTSACGSLSSNSKTFPSHNNRSSQTADVAYAGSLELLNHSTIGPNFRKTTGYSYLGRGGGSFGLAKEITSGSIHPNVFESIGSAPIKTLEPKWTNSYIQFASSPIVVAYNPSSPYASELKSIAKGKTNLSKLFILMSKPGFHLGRTNPNTDPQGQAFYMMVQLAQKNFNLPPYLSSKILGSVNNSSEIFSETALESRLQAGQLDAASAFESQAIQLHLPYISLPSSINFGNIAYSSSYAKASMTLANKKTIHGSTLVLDATVIGKKDQAAARAFIDYLLSPQGRGSIKKAGYKLLKPQLFGPNPYFASYIKTHFGNTST